MAKKFNINEEYDTSGQASEDQMYQQATAASDEEVSEPTVESVQVPSDQLATMKQLAVDGNYEALGKAFASLIS